MKLSVSFISMVIASSNVNAFAPSSNTPMTSTSTQLHVSTSSPSSTDTATSPKATSPMFEHLKFDNSPTFDVLAKTQQYVQQTAMDGKVDESYYASDYVLRGPVIGPIGRKDLSGSQNGLGLFEAYPNVKIDSFGFNIDPENNYRCFYFQRWRAVMEGDLDAYGDVYPATDQEAEMPVSVFSVVWNPDGKIVYEQVGAVVDRLEGNTQGKAAVFGLLHNAGLKIPASPGDKVFQFLQRLGHLKGDMGRSWSRESDIPKWWVSKSRGADDTEQW